MNRSLWSKTCQLPKFPQLEGDIQTDILVIGGGLCGLLTAYFLKWAGVDCCLVEGRRIASGVSGLTTAKISSLQGLTYHTLMKNKGKEKTQQYFQACQLAINRYECMSKFFECDFERVPAYTYTKHHRRKIEDEVHVLRCIGGEAEFIENLHLPFGTVEAVKLPHQAQFHPLKFIQKIIDGLTIYENTNIHSIQNHTAKGEKASINAKRIIVTTHFPFINRYGGYSLKMFQERSYVIAMKNKTKLYGMYADEDKQGLSFRVHGDLLLVGGNTHKTGHRTNGWESLVEWKNQYLSEEEVLYSWSNQDCMTLDGLPYIGQYSWRTPNLFVATGFQKWGMTGSMIAALLLRDLVLERKNEYSALFSPQRNIFHKQLFYNTVDNMKNFVSYSPKRCPHLGCALQWNAAEHSWDCPCHGSRFSEHGTLLDNPANKPL